MPQGRKTAVKSGYRGIMYYKYGEKEIEYLKRKDKKLGAVIDFVGSLQYEVDEDLTAAVVHQIIGQQISGAALATVWGKLKNKLEGEITAEQLNNRSAEELQSCGMSQRKAGYILDFAKKVTGGEIDLEILKTMPDQKVIETLCTIRGIGEWTAQMMLIFGLKRPDVVSYGDFGIRRGMRMLYHHRELDKEKFLRYAKRYSPYGTVASFYLWAVAGGAMPGLKDPGV